MTTEKTLVSKIELALEDIQKEDFKTTIKLKNDNQIIANIETNGYGMYSYACEYEDEEQIMYTALIYSTKFDHIPLKNGMELHDIVNIFNRKILGAKCVLMDKELKKMRFIVEIAYSNNVKASTIADDIVRQIKTTKKTISFFKEIVAEPE